MNSSRPVFTWRFHKFGLIVTGKGEEKFLPTFLRSLTEAGDCTFQVIHRIEQLAPITSEKRKLKMVGTNKSIPTKDVENIGLPARSYLNQHPDHYVILIDDLEHDSKDQHREKFERYRSAIDEVLPEACRHRAAVHFLANMLEAYYFADIDVVNEILGTELPSHDGDVESIRNPKRDLKKAKPGFDEVSDGHEIVKRLDLEHVLDRSDTCASLRALFTWCRHAKGGDATHRFQLTDGICSPVTGQQVAQLCRTSGHCSGEQIRMPEQ